MTNAKYTADYISMVNQHFGKFSMGILILSTLLNSARAQLPDLYPTGLQINGQAVADQPVDIAYQGHGFIQAGYGWYDKLYLSTDAVWDTGDTVIGGRNYEDSQLLEDVYYSRVRTVTVPRVVPGVYYLILRIDDDNNIVETNETNNARALAIQIDAPDLYPTALQVNGPAVADQPVEIEWSITNQGTGPTQAEYDWFDRLYLSADAVWDGGDTVIGGNSENGPLLAGAAYSRTNMVTVPRVAPGMYYLILKTDTGNNIFEGIETNNTRVEPLVSIILLDISFNGVTSSLQWPSTIDEWHLMESTNLLKDEWQSSILVPSVSNETYQVIVIEQIDDPIFFRLEKSF